MKRKNITKKETTIIGIYKTTKMERDVRETFLSLFYFFFTTLEVEDMNHNILVIDTSFISVELYMLIILATNFLSLTNINITFTHIHYTS